KDSILQAGNLINEILLKLNLPDHSLKALEERYSSKNCVRKFFRALNSNWRAKVMTIEESKDLTSLSLDELMNLKVHEMIIKKDFKIVKAKRERRSLALKDKKKSCDEETLTSKSEDEEYAMAVKNFKKLFKKFFKRRGRFIRQPWNDKKAFQRSRDDKNDKIDRNDEEDNEKAKDETCLVALTSSKVHSESSYFSDENSLIDDIMFDSECYKFQKNEPNDNL
nr:UBN2 domain-containing protein [Tanacetum cinerariifolium]